MPYIRPASREHFDDLIEKIVFEAKEYDIITERPGVLNYAITRLIAGAMLVGGNPISYGNMSRMLAIFRDAEAEMRRRLLDTYEDKAIAKNGDIPEYESP